MQVKKLARSTIEGVENRFDDAFSPAWNPLYHLGALGWFFFWIVAISGIYLYIFFDTGITRAYQSVEDITHGQWYAGGVMRSFHRYASDALVIVVLLHLVREYVMDRLRGRRWFAWITGVPLLWLMFACGISGYWLVWDKLAQYVAIMTTEWLDTLPFFADPIARNFLNGSALSGRFFTLMVFIHIAVPLFMLFAMWIHIQRHSLPKVNPPRGLAIGTLVMLIALAMAFPALSQGGPADLDVVISIIRPDWFYLAMYPMLDIIPGQTLWVFFALVTLLLFLLPWLPPKRPPPVAVVDLDNCNGCGRCIADCPYSAITLSARTDGKAFAGEAQVNESYCTSCGLCVGSCPTATPFRRSSELISGIDLPDLPIERIRAQLLEQSARLTGDQRIVVFGCASGGELNALEGPEVTVLQLPCVGNLPPSFIDFVISRRHADGVLLTGCREGDCHFRLGIRWTEQRLAGERDPYLRKRVPRERIAVSWTGPTRHERLHGDLQRLRSELETLGPNRQARAPALLHVSAAKTEVGEDV